jgi:hypothetical protein
VASAAMTVGAAYKPGEMTCEDFVALADVEKPKVVYWAEGFNKNGKALDSVVDVTETDKMVPIVVSDCMKFPKEPLVKAIQRQPAATMKPVATAPKPAKMRCDEFVALEDVARPKVVYWAEGFNKDGGQPTLSSISRKRTGWFRFSSKSAPTSPSSRSGRSSRNIFERAQFRRLMDQQDEP